MLAPFLSLAMRAPARQSAFRRAAVAHLLFVSAMGATVLAAPTPGTFQLFGYGLLAAGTAAVPGGGCAAPEMHRGDLTDTSDQYSLAITYYYLRTGIFPFPTPPAGFQREYSYTRPAPDLTRVGRSERFVLEKALEIEPTARWSCCTALMLALEEAVNHPERVPTTSSAMLRRPAIVLPTPARG